MKKRLLAVFIVFCMAIVVFCGCATENKTTLQEEIKKQKVSEGRLFDFETDTCGWQTYANGQNDIAAHYDSLSLLRQEQDRLTMLLQKITDKINKIKSEYPYTLKKLISTPEKIKEEKEKLQNIIADFQNLLTAYQARINTLLNT